VIIWLSYWITQWLRATIHGSTVTIELHYFTRLTALCPGLPGKTNLDFTEARDSEWHWHQLGHMQICTSLQTNTSEMTYIVSSGALNSTPPPHQQPNTQFFTGWMPFLLPNQQRQGTESSQQSLLKPTVKCLTHVNWQACQFGLWGDRAFSEVYNLFTTPPITMKLQSPACVQFDTVPTTDTQQQPDREPKPWAKLVEPLAGNRG